MLLWETRCKFPIRKKELTPYPSSSEQQATGKTGEVLAALAWPLCLKQVSTWLVLCVKWDWVSTFQEVKLISSKLTPDPFESIERNGRCNPWFSCYPKCAQRNVNQNVSGLNQNNVDSLMHSIFYIMRQLGRTVQMLFDSSPICRSVIWIMYILG